MNYYDIEYKYLDELEEKGWRGGCVIVYDSNTEDGREFADALSDANETDNFSEVDKILTEDYDLKDEDITFYYDLAGISDYGGASRGTRLVAELQKNFDILIHNIN